MAQKAQMMLPIGNKSFLLQRRGPGFTLVEVMVSVAILSLGIILIYESFFTSLAAYQQYSHYLEVLPWMNEKIWQAEEAIIRFGEINFIENKGEFIQGGKIFTWSLFQDLVDEKEGLYRIDFLISWPEAKREIKLFRYIYAVHKK